MKILLFAVTIAFLSSCASINLPPAPGKLEDIKSNLGRLDQEVSSSKADQWAALFLNAQYFEKEGKKIEACGFYTKLSEDKNFPLQALAKLERTKVCQLTTQDLELFWEQEYKKSPSWLREYFAELSLQIASRNKNKKYIAHFSALKAKFEKIQSDKVEYIRKAINFAPDEDREKYVEQLYRTAPHTYPKPNNDNVMTIAKDFEKNRRFVEARKLYWKILKSKDFDFKEKLEAYDRIRLSFKLQRNTKKYLKYTKRMDRFIRRNLHQNFDNPEYQKAWIDSQITLARLFWTENNPRKARVILLSLLQKKIPFPDLEGLIHLVLAGIALEDGKNIEAIELLTAAKTIAVEDNELKDKINWAYGWNLFLDKKYDNSAQAFESAIKETDNYFFKIKCSFWEAQSYIAAGRVSDGHALLEELTELDSFGYYGIMAHRELKKPFSSLAHLYTDPHVVEPKISTFEWLLAVDKQTLAKEFLRQNGSKLFKTKQQIEAALPLYQKAGDYTWAIHKFYRIDAPERDNVLARKAHIVFPTPFKQKYQKVAARFSHTPEYLFSISRQESAFDPEARSPAEAYGLMQLIPKRAQELSRRFNIRYRSPKDLYKPATNIFMGGALLRTLRKDLKNNFVLTTASYNAKISAVKRWYKTRFKGDYLKFIEMVPYSETQGYIKLVLRNFIAYKRLASNSKFLFPENVFSGEY